MTREVGTKSISAELNEIRRTELIISQVLRLGVSASLMLVWVGLMIMFFEDPSYLQSHADLRRLTEPGAAFPHTTADVLKGVATFQGQAIVILGLLLLIATPIARVAISVVSFAYQGDRVFFLITLFVLLVIVVPILLGGIS